MPVPTLKDPNLISFFDDVFKVSYYIGLGLYIFKINLVPPRKMPLLFFVMSFVIQTWKFTTLPNWP